MTVLKREQFPLKTSSDVVSARQRVRQMAIELRFSLVDQTKLVTACERIGAQCPRSRPRRPNDASK